MVTSLDIGATSPALAGGDPKLAGLHGKGVANNMTGHWPHAPHDLLSWHASSLTSNNKETDLLI